MTVSLNALPHKEKKEVVKQLGPVPRSLIIRLISRIRDILHLDF